MKVYGRTPLNLQQTVIPRGQVYLILDRCKECEICIEFCPHHILRKSIKTNAKGYHTPEIAPDNEEDCIHCQFCSLVCPEFAIFTCEVVQ